MIFLFLIAVISVFYSHVDSACPSGWLPHASSCYFFSHDTEQWIGAMNVCKLLGGQLVEIETAEEDNYIRAQAKLVGESYWIALSDIEEEGTYVWMNSKTPLVAGDYTFWHQGQPDNADNDENCVNLEDSFNMDWNDLACHTNLNYICERPNDDVDVIG